MQLSEPVSGASVDSIKQRRDLLVARGELERVRRRLDQSERALDSLSQILSLVPDPIEVVASDYTVLFANRASRLLHENEQLEGTVYYRSVMGLDEPPGECPIRRAVEDDRETTYTAACDNGDAYEVATTPIVLSDGRRAAMCYSKPVVVGVDVGETTGGPVTHDEDETTCEPLSGRAAAAGESPTVEGQLADVSFDSEDDEKRILQRIAELSSSMLDAVLAQVKVGVLLTNARFEPILFNKSFRELTGFNGSDPSSLPGILFPDRRAGTSQTAAIGDLVARTETGSLETDIVRGDGERVPVEMAVSRIPGKGEDDTVVLFTLQDLRETREIKDQLRVSLRQALAGITVKSEPGEGAVLEIRLPVRSPDDDSNDSRGDNDSNDPGGSEGDDRTGSAA